MQLWLIPLLPLAGLRCSTDFSAGALSKAVINAIAIGSVLLSFLWVLKACVLGRFRAVTHRNDAYVEHYFTWIQSRDAEHRRAISRSTG